MTAKIPETRPPSWGSSATREIILSAIVELLRSQGVLTFDPPAETVDELRKLPSFLFLLSPPSTLSSPSTSSASRLSLFKRKVMSDSPEYLTPAEFDLIQPLARELFAPFDSSRDDLVQSALATLAILQDNLKRDYAYQFVEFRDKRKLETILDSCDREIGRGKEKPKWEMTRSQVEELKQHRKSLKLASKEADLALGKDLLKGEFSSTLETSLPISPA